MSNSVGDVTYRQVKGQTVASNHVPRTSTSLATPAQSKQRVTFGSVAKFVGRQRPVIDRTFEQTKKGWSFNQYMKQNYHVLKNILTATQQEHVNVYNLANAISTKGARIYSSYGGGYDKTPTVALLGTASAATGVTINLPLTAQIDNIGTVVVSLVISDANIQYMRGVFAEYPVTSAQLLAGKFTQDVPFTALPALIPVPSATNDLTIMALVSYKDSTSRKISKSYVQCVKLGAEAIDSGIVDGGSGGDGGGDGVVEV